MNDKLNLTVDSIFDKHFNVDFKGYNAKEVDSFLDLVMEDYQTLHNLINEFDSKIDELERINTSLKADLIEERGKAKAFEEASVPSNLDIIKRISRLEQEVFNRR